MNAAPGAMRLALDVVLLWLGFFAGWSAVSIPLTLGCWPVASLWLACAGGVVGAALAILSLRAPLAQALLPPAESAGTVPLPAGRSALVWIGGILALGVAALAFIATSNAVPLWAVLLVMALASSQAGGRQADGQGVAQQSASNGGAALGLVVLGLGILALYVVVLRYDSDDAFYLNLPVGLLSGKTCMMAADTMLGVEGWPLLGSNYRVEALPTLTAAVSWASGLSVVTVGHFVLPVVWCVVWACTLAVIGHGLFGRNWIVFAVLAVLASLALAGTLQTWGVHGVGRMFHGKAPLILIVVPLMAWIVVRSAGGRMGLGPALASLTGLSLTAVGLTANAIYLAPLALFMALAASALAFGQSGLRKLPLILAALPPVAAGLWLLLFDRPVGASDGGGSPWSQLALWDMAAQKTTLAVVIATLSMAALAGLVGRGGRWVSGYLAAFLIFVMNPLLWPVYDRFVTGGLNFRLWWALPVPTFLAMALTWGLIRIGLPRAGGALAAAGLAGMSVLPTGLLGMPETLLHPSIHKLPPDRLPVVREVLAIAPPEGTVLAPESIAALLPIWEGHPKLVFSRVLYLEHNAPLLTPEQLEPRKRLADWVSGAAEVPVPQVVEALRQLGVRVIVLEETPLAVNAQTVMQQAGASPAATVAGHVLWTLPPQ